MPRDPDLIARDIALIDRLIADDVDALRALMTVHGDQLATVALIVTRSHDLAREAVQDVFVQLWESRYRLRSMDISNGVAGYLVTMTRRRALDLIRHEQSQTRVKETIASQRTSPTTQNEGEQALESAELNAHVRAAIDELPPRCREIFLLSRQTGLSYDEIAVSLGISKATIGNQVYRALQHIAQAIERWRSGA